MSEQNNKEKHTELYRAIDEILWKDWDPIGVNESYEARDEYQSYTPEIFTLKINGADKETIAQKLNEITVKRMGLFGNLDHCRQVANKILSTSPTLNDLL